ncbi:MAG: hypothetical protein ACK5II_11390 [Paracoccus sp. (in: a-proteobacteria)]
MRTALRVILVGLLVLTSQSLAVARGQNRLLSEQVICAGGGMATITVDEQGQPARRMVICPDMALSLMAAIVVGIQLPTEVSEPALSQAYIAMPELGMGRMAPAAHARGPPLRKA